MSSGSFSLPSIVFAGEISFVSFNFPRTIFKKSCTLPDKEIPCKYSDKQLSASVEFLGEGPQKFAGAILPSAHNLTTLLLVAPNSAEHQINPQRDR